MGWDIKAMSSVIVVIADDNKGKSITSQPEVVVAELHACLRGGLTGLALFYRDTDGRYDELVHDNGVFVEIRALTGIQGMLFSDVFPELAELP